MIFLLNKSQFSMNSVFVVKVKIPFSHVLKTGLQFLQISSYLRDLLFFFKTSKIYSNIYYNKAQNYVHE